jgi:3-deoxy-D-manno-octulosonic-acid transferase
VKLPFNIYDVAYLTITPPAAAMLGYKMLRHGKYKESAPAMLGQRLQEEDPALWANGCVWVHGVSVGEVIAARAMLPLLRQHFAPLPILLTTHTETGQATANSLPAGMADAIRYYPLDFSWLIRKYVNVYKPRVFIPMETELWPNALDIVSRSGAQIFTLNGKMSENSFNNYQKIGKLIRKPLSRITAFCVQTEADANRIGTLLGHRNNIHVTGNCKFDVEIPTLNATEKAALATELGLPWPARYVVAGSTHPGEEEIILAAFSQAVRQFPDLRLIIVPRHPERFNDVWNLLQQHPFPACRVSTGATTGSGEQQVHLVDRMGLLTRLYALSQIAIVAGSFAPGIGGHNILEPAAHAVPVIYGPHMKSQPDMVRILSQENGGTCSSSQSLGDDLVALLTDPAAAAAKGAAGQLAYLSNRGSALRNMEVIAQYTET